MMKDQTLLLMSDCGPHLFTALPWLWAAPHGGGGISCASVPAPPLHPHLSKDPGTEEDRARRDTCRLKASHLPRGTQVFDLAAWNSVQPIRTHVNPRFC